MNNTEIAKTKLIKTLLRKRIEIRKEIIYLNKKLEILLDSGKKERNINFKLLQSIRNQNYEEFIKIFIIYKAH